MNGAVIRRVAAWLAALTTFVGAIGVAGPPNAEPVGASAMGCAPSPVGGDELNAAFSRPGLGARADQEGYGGGDYQHAYGLPDGRVLWLFQDLHFSNDE